MKSKMFDASKCVIPNETLGQRLTRMTADIRVHNPNRSVPALKFKTIGRVTVLFRTKSKVGVSIMEYTDMVENRQVFDLAVYSHKSAREVYEELRNTNRILEATQRFNFRNDWDLVYRLIELLS